MLSYRTLIVLSPEPSSTEEDSVEVSRPSNCLFSRWRLLTVEGSAVGSSTEKKLIYDMFFGSLEKANQLFR